MRVSVSDDEHPGPVCASADGAVGVGPAAGHATSRPSSGGQHQPVENGARARPAGREQEGQRGQRGGGGKRRVEVTSGFFLNSDCLVRVTCSDVAMQ